MKKIAVITPFLAQGGLEKVAVTGAKELEAYYDVTMIVFDTYKIDYPYEGKLIDLGIAFNDRNIFKRVFNLLRISLKLRKIKKEQGFDLLIVHGELANLSAVFSGSGNHIVVIHENRFSAIKDIQSKFFSLVSKRIYHAKNTQKIVTVSKGIAEEFVMRFGLTKNQVITIYNPYEIETIQKKSQEPMERYGELFAYDVLIAAARLTEQKGHRYLLQIFQQYVKHHPKTKLLLLGDGELRDMLIIYAKALELKVFSAFDEDVLSLDYDVYFIGFHTNPYQYIARSNLFIMTSLWEGFGNTIVESMACGTPVISTDCPSGPKEIIAPEFEGDVSEETFARYGVIMPAFEKEKEMLSDESVRQWHTAIEKLLGDSEAIETYREKGKLRAKDFEMRGIMREWKEVIEESLS